MPDTMVNQPPFDPLNPTPEEDADMVQGFMDGYAKIPPTRDSLAYAWGRGSAARDHGDEPDEQRREVERRHFEQVQRMIKP
jgi:hypothetical protein